MKIVSVDPGGETGITTLRWQPPPHTKLRWWTWNFDELGPAKHHQALSLFLTGELSLGPFILLVEGFDNRANPAAELISCEYIGVTEAWSQAHNVPIIYTQPANKSRRAWGSEAKLKSLGLWAPTMAKPHARDAASHIVHHVCNNMRGTEIRTAFLQLLKEHLT